MSAARLRQSLRAKQRRTAADMPIGSHWSPRRHPNLRAVPIPATRSTLTKAAAHVRLDRVVRMVAVCRNSAIPNYWPCLAMASAIFAFIASRLKLAPFCAGGNSIAVIASFATSRWTNTNRQNSSANQSQYW